MNKLAILLATYNSQKFLAQQLDSLYNQTEKNWSLYIRDDGSDDDTLLIVDDFRKRYGNITLVDDRKSGLGAMRSFLTLLNEVDADYYMFCDHDDIWLPNKIELSIEKMLSTEREHPDKPVIIHTDLTVVNDDLKVINASFWEMSAIKPNTIEDKNLIQVFNCVTGCTMIFNCKVKALAFPFVNEAPMHDWWLALQTLRNNGVIKHLKEKTILYRQHTLNEIGARNVKLGYFVKKITDLKNTLNGQFKQIRFLKKINGLSALQYYYYKLFYTIYRNL